MNLPLVLRPEAEGDILAGKDWYENQRAGLGSRFSDRVAELIDRIALFPMMYAVGDFGVRVAQVRKFPYLVYYRVLADHVEVLAVLQASRDEVERQSRL